MHFLKGFEQQNDRKTPLMCMKSIAKAEWNTFTAIHMALCILPYCFNLIRPVDSSNFWTGSFQIKGSVSI